MKAINYVLTAGDTFDYDNRRDRFRKCGWIEGSIFDFLNYHPENEERKKVEVIKIMLANADDTRVTYATSLGISDEVIKFLRYYREDCVLNIQGLRFFLDILSIEEHDFDYDKKIYRSFPEALISIFRDALI